MSSRGVSTSVAPRRHLSERQADTVARLTDATVEELRASDFEGLTVRNVARRAGVAPATAYTYFASKEHLVTEVYWRRLQSLPETDPSDGAAVADRVAEVMAPLGVLVADEPELAAACTVALLANDAEVGRLRELIGRHTESLLRRALGPDSPPEALRTLSATFSGLLVQAGVGALDYHDVAARMQEAASVVFGSPSAASAGASPIAQPTTSSEPS